uniref:hypothetical protein n=1 Tax=Gordonia sp. B7-2 TaxID=3420932 RepID=UPI003D945E54
MTIDEAATRLGVGDHVSFRGSVLRIETFDGLRVVAHDRGAELARSIDLGVLLAESQPCSSTGEVLFVEQDLQWDLTSAADRFEAEREAQDMHYIVTGSRTLGQQGAPLLRKPGIQARTKEIAKARGVSIRTISRRRERYEERHSAVGCARVKAPRRRVSAIDPRWEDALDARVAKHVDMADLSRKIALEDVQDTLNEMYGEGVVRIPSKSTAYTFIKQRYRGTNAFTGSTKGRRSIAERPDSPLGRLVATHAGQYVIMDTQVLDVFTENVATGKWARCQLTVAQDLFTRAILGLLLTQVSTKAIDVASVLFEVCFPQPIEGKIHPRATWHYHGVPENLVFTELGDRWGLPLAVPESLIIDNGRAFLSTHVLDVCHRKGINVMPAQPYKPTDKPTVERFFLTLRQELIMRLPGYTGPDVHSRGKRPEKQSFYFMHELELIIRNWICRYYHKNRHSGLIHPGFPTQKQSPNSMYELSVAVHGLPRIAHDPYAFAEFLPIRWRMRQHYGFEVGQKRRYSGKILKHIPKVSAYGGKNAGKWPVRYNPDDIRSVYIQHPETFKFAPMRWEHADKFDVALSEDMYGVMRSQVVTGRNDSGPERTKDILTDFSPEKITARRERNVLSRARSLADKVPSVDGSLHQAYLQASEAGDADDTLPKPQDLIEESAWDAPDDGEDCSVDAANEPALSTGSDGPPQLPVELVGIVDEEYCDDGLLDTESAAIDSDFAAQSYLIDPDTASRDMTPAQADDAEIIILDIM